MITVVLKSSDDFLEKLNKILTATKERGETAVTILTSRLWHMDLYQTMMDMDSQKIGKLKMGSQTFFIIKEMRVELKPIDLYI